MTVITTQHGILTVEKTGNEPTDQVWFNLTQDEGEPQLIVIPNWKFDELIKSLANEKE